jgi:hypothetical protein
VWLSFSIYIVTSFLELLCRTRRVEAACLGQCCWIYSSLARAVAAAYMLNCVTFLADSAQLACRTLLPFAWPVCCCSWHHRRNLCVFVSFLEGNLAAMVMGRSACTCRWSRVLFWGGLAFSLWFMPGCEAQQGPSAAAAASGAVATPGDGASLAGNAKAAVTHGIFFWNGE